MKKVLINILFQSNKDQVVEEAIQSKKPYLIGIIKQYGNAKPTIPTLDKILHTELQ